MIFLPQKLSNMDKHCLIIVHTSSFSEQIGQDLAEIVRIYNLNQDEKGILSQKEQGRGLLFVGSGHMLINVKALPWEKEYLVGGGR